MSTLTRSQVFLCGYCTGIITAAVIAALAHV
jgi:hypothetical protein